MYWLPPCVESQLHRRVFESPPNPAPPTPTGAEDLRLQPRAARLAALRRWHEELHGLQEAAGLRLRGGGRAHLRRQGRRWRRGALAAPLSSQGLQDDVSKMSSL